jgi:hypothetical protein
MSPDYDAGLRALETQDAETAERLFRAALAQDPASDDAALHLGFALLMQGRFAEGWPYYDRRRPYLRSPLHRAPFPQWTGGPLDGRSIILVGEQGLGDEVQLSRYVPLVRALRPKRLIVAPLGLNVRVFEALGADEVLPRETTGRLPPLDRWALFGSLPRAFGTTLETLPPPVAPMPRIGGGGVGFVAGSQPKNPTAAIKSLPPDTKLPGARPLTPQGDMLESFRQVAELDLLISVDTSWAHVAGTLGVPCWLLLPHEGVDWRWLRGRRDSPWYPSMRLYRQPAPGDWESVLAEVRRDLAEGASRTA